MGDETKIKGFFNSLLHPCATLPTALVIKIGNMNYSCPQDRDALIEPAILLHSNRTNYIWEAFTETPLKVLFGTKFLGKCFVALMKSLQLFESCCLKLIHWWTVYCHFEGSPK